MRENIGLYRGKRIDNDEWVEGWYYKRIVHLNTFHQNVVVDAIEVYDGENPLSIAYYDVYPETVGQYTGLTDKNGKKIFEGDIIKCEHTIRFAKENEDYSKIRYSYGGVLVKTTPDELVEFFGESYEYRYLRNYVIEYFRGKLRLRNKSCTNDLVWRYIINHNIEVIGNIHDNKLEDFNGR